MKSSEQSNGRSEGFSSHLSQWFSFPSRSCVSWFLITLVAINISLLAINSSVRGFAISLITPPATSSRHDREIQWNRIMSRVKHTQQTCGSDIKGVVTHELYGDGFAHIFHCLSHSFTAAVAHGYKFCVRGTFSYSPTPNKKWTDVFEDPCNDCKWIDKNYSKIPVKELPGEVNAFAYFKHNESLAREFFSGFPHHAFDNAIIYRLWSSGYYSEKYLNYGSFWLRSFTSMYLWSTLRANVTKPVREHQTYKQLRSQPRPKYIGFHIRRTDNIGAHSSFGMGDSHELLTFSNFMVYAKKIREKDPHVKTIFVATDSATVKDEVRYWRKESDWRIIMNPHVQRATEKDGWMWFTKSQQNVLDVILDLELLRLADYTVGTMTSNVYRLAAELNYASHWVSKYDEQIKGIQRIFSIDVPWFQDP